VLIVDFTRLTISAKGIRPLPLLMPNTKHYKS
jgi:hypothetical protein